MSDKPLHETALEAVYERGRREEGQHREHIYALTAAETMLGLAEDAVALTAHVHDQTGDDDATKRAFGVVCSILGKTPAIYVSEDVRKCRALVLPTRPSDRLDVIKLRPLGVALEENVEHVQHMLKEAQQQSV